MIEQEILKILQDNQLAGVRYNVIRRPLSGGLHSITRRKGTKGTKCSKCKGTGKEHLKGYGFNDLCSKCKGAGRIGGRPEEAKDAFYARLGNVIREHPGDFFYRWNVRVTPGDVERFRRECLDPILENMLDWYQMITSFPDPWQAIQGIHWRHPYGAVNQIDQGYSSDVEEYLKDGSTVGLTRTDTVFPELS